MAKQTFTTGSVLTATQMNDLQTNDFNWTVNQKTTSYVLVASDKGTRIEMNSGSATTVTVNTGLFAAGDTLFIQNIGTGVCTVTAGTATVNRAAAASLALAQWQGGYLYFISASSAVFFADAGFTPPLTTKGDLFTWDTGNARLPVGTNGQVLTAQSGQATGLQWATLSAGSETLISTTSLSGLTTSITGFGSSYTHLRLKLININISSTQYVNLGFNSSTSAIYASAAAGGVSTVEGTTSANQIRLNTGVSYLFNGDTRNTLTTDIYFYNDSIVSTRTSAFIYNNSMLFSANTSAGGANIGSAITSIQVIGGNSLNGGTAVLYGVR